MFVVVVVLVLCVFLFRCVLHCYRFILQLVFELRKMSLQDQLSK